MDSPPLRLPLFHIYIACIGGELVATPNRHRWAGGTNENERGKKRNVTYNKPLMEVQVLHEGSLSCCTVYSFLLFKNWFTPGPDGETYRINFEYRHVMDAGKKMPLPMPLRATGCERSKHLVAHQNHSRILSGLADKKKRGMNIAKEKKTVTVAHPRSHGTILTNGERPQTALNIFLFVYFFFFLSLFKLFVMASDRIEWTLSFEPATAHHG